MNTLTRALGLALVSCAATTITAHAQAPDAPSEVFVLATLYRRHATTPAYGHDTLRRLIERIRPDVVVLDVSPRELRDQTVHPSKAEYPEVIFPLVRERGLRAYPGEPDEPEFTEIVTGVSRALRAFAADTVAARADDALELATFGALARLWQSPADVNGALTDELLAARHHYQDRVAPYAVADGWRRWNGHAAGVVRRARRENPGRRILVLIGVENCGPLRAALGREPAVRLINMEDWLRSNAAP